MVNEEVRKDWYEAPDEVSYPDCGCGDVEADGGDFFYKLGRELDMNERKNGCRD